MPLLPITNCVPSGVDFDTRSEPTVPPAPTGFSTTTVWPSTSLSAGRQERPATSLGPPAANGTTIVSVRFGRLCAAAGPASAIVSKAAKALHVANWIRVMNSSCELARHEEAYHQLGDQGLHENWWGPGGVSAEPP